MTSKKRQGLVLVFYGIVAAATIALLLWASAQPHSAAPASEGEGPAAAVTLAPGTSATAKFPDADVTTFRTITEDTLAKLQAGDQRGATARIKDLETAWDDAQSTLQPLDDTGWTYIDGHIDTVLTSLRATTPDSTAEVAALTSLLTALN